MIFRNGNFRWNCRIQIIRLVRTSCKKIGWKIIDTEDINYQPKWPLYREKVMCYSTLFIGIIIFSLNARKVIMMDFSCVWIYFIFCFNILFATSVWVSSLENPGNFIWKSYLFIVFCCDSKVEIFCNKIIVTEMTRFRFLLHFFLCWDKWPFSMAESLCVVLY